PYTASYAFSLPDALPIFVGDSLEGPLGIGIVALEPVDAAQPVLGLRLVWRGRFAVDGGAQHFGSRPQYGALRFPAVSDRLILATDRKSTRLNSSHEWSSY